MSVDLLYNHHVPCSLVSALGSGGALSGRVWFPVTFWEIPLPGIGIPQFRTESRALWYGMGRNNGLTGQILFGLDG